MDQNPRIKSAYEKVFRQSYVHYDFWVYIMMGAKDFFYFIGENELILDKIISWSKTNSILFNNEQEMIGTLVIKMNVLLLDTYPRIIVQPPH